VLLYVDILQVCRWETSGFFARNYSMPGPYRISCSPFEFLRIVVPLTRIVKYALFTECTTIDRSLSQVSIFKSESMQPPNRSITLSVYGR